MYHSKDAAVVCFSVDDTFTGTMLGVAEEEGEGCNLSGQCVLHVKRPIKVSRFVLFFEGRCKVHLNKANGYGMTGLSGTSETRSLYCKQQDFLGQDGKMHILQPGVHLYQFSFDLPSHLPASFHGSRGYIRYRLTSVIYRSMLSTDLRSSMDITIKRCLIPNMALMANHLETVYGTKHTEKIQYSGTATSMAYREGGQIQLNLAIQLRQPQHYRITSITSALLEQVKYRTTDSQSRVMVARSDDLYPLGYNTICPDQSSNYDSAKQQNYTSLIRLIPRVNADTNSRLIQVTHSLVVKIMLQQQLGNNDDHTADKISGTTTEIFQNHQLTTKDNQFTSGSASNQINDQRQDPSHEQPRTLLAPSALHHGIITPPPSNSTSSSLDRSLSSSPLKSIFSLKTNIDGNSLLPKNTTPQIQEKQPYDRNSFVVCTLEIPVIVTSRLNALEDDILGCPPSYLQTASEVAPDYIRTLETFPVVPSYGDANNCNNNEHLDE